MLCKTQDKAFNAPEYIWEEKFDGARILAVVRSGQIHLFGRSGAEKTNLFPDLRIEVAMDCILDGEVISGNSFNDMQHRINRQTGIGQAIKDFPAKFMVFDMLEAGDLNLRNLTLERRKIILQHILIPTDNVMINPWVDDGVKLFDEIKARKGEGVIGKIKTGLYRENARDWLKVKTWQEGVFYVRGYTRGTGWRQASFGALVLGDGMGKYVGEVGTGFDDDMIKSLMIRLRSSADVCPWSKEPEPANWVKPFAVKIQYLEYTNDGKLRFPSFKGVI